MAKRLPKRADRSAPAPVAEIVDPTSGEVVLETDLDGLMAIWRSTGSMMQQCFMVRDRIKAILTARAPAPSSGRTVRVRGERLQAKVSFPDLWDRKALRGIWDAYPKIAPQFLKISEVSIIAKEVAKLSSTDGNEEFIRFKEALLAAYAGHGSPSVAIEDIDNADVQEETGVADDQAS